MLKPATQTEPSPAGWRQRLHVAHYPGTGIGLSIVRKGIERMGGQVGLESEPGKGSRFWLEFQVSVRDSA